jgi:CDGSH-type Zn-finger protein
MDDLEKKPRIKVTKNGPYIVTEGVPLGQEIMVLGSDGEPTGWEKGAKYPEKEIYALCRCGESKTMPFCDGSHAAAGFNGEETATHKPYMDRAEKTTGPGMDLTYVQGLCSAARFCHKAGDAWSLTERSDDPQAKSLAMQEACDCPSGSLVAWDKDTGEPIEPEFEPSISLVENPQAGESGPIWVKGRIPVESADGREYEVRNRVALCRCGKSDNKPFCDGRHVSVKFRAGS